MSNDYKVSFDAHAVDLILRQLSKWKMANIVDDEYAGELIQLGRARSDEAWDEADSVILGRAWEGGGGWFDRVFRNEKFWSAVEHELTDNLGAPIVTEPVNDPVPASDRIVTISHNSPEGTLIVSAINTALLDLDQNNLIAAEAGGERERLVAEGKASIELLKGERIKRGALIEVVWKFLKEIMSKFKEKSIDWGVDKSVAILEKMLDLLN
ncbi:hypothetical protein IFT67_04075 [Sphingomonas sp. CFBP 13728]|uniref:hypothetical protein n=1 Tax=Sphingomonas sp. CFBP 13728 TaxID=2775294 RepID=UPI00178020FC|nr:hypothetical protein [Sphingomonas sp. CFBP 13728]MBD8618091.1 hypothetical protein [Sphingomonas sp. CFBP 13728]